MNVSPSSRTVEILLVEDSPSDAQLMREALRESRLSNSLHTVADGEEAMTFLRRLPPYDSAPRPDLIFLDLNLPRKSGREVLADLKADEQLRNIPVCVLTTSSHENDIAEAYALDASCYLTKPLDVEDFISQVQAVYNFWFPKSAGS